MRLVSTSMVCLSACLQVIATKVMPEKLRRPLLLAAVVASALGLATSIKGYKTRVRQ